MGIEIHWVCQGTICALSQVEGLEPVYYWDKWAMFGLLGYHLYILHSILNCKTEADKAILHNFLNLFIHV